MSKVANLHTLTHSAIEDLQHAFTECEQKPIEVRILSAIITVKMVHDFLVAPEEARSDYDPEEYCSAI